MNYLNNYCAQNFKALILSKVFLVSLYNYPKLNKLVFFFLISSKQYKKSVFLFYIVMSIFFCRVKIIRKKSISSLNMLTILINKNKKMFLLVFINFYLPLLGSVENKLKYGVSTIKSKNFFFLKYYRVNYFSFPVIPELDLMYEQYETVFNIVSNYRLQIDFIVKTKSIIKDSSLFLIRMLRFPCVLKIKSYV